MRRLPLPSIAFGKLNVKADRSNDSTRCGFIDRVWNFQVLCRSPLFVSYILHGKQKALVDFWNTCNKFFSSTDPGIQSAGSLAHATGVGNKRFFRFKRNVQHMWTAIIRHHLNDITHQQVMRFNQWSKFANIFEDHLKKIPMLRDTRAVFSDVLLNMSHVCPSWYNGSLLGPHVLNGYGSMTSATTNIYTVKSLI